MKRPASKLESVAKRPASHLRLHDDDSHGEEDTVDLITPSPSKKNAKPAESEVGAGGEVQKKECNGVVVDVTLPAETRAALLAQTKDPGEKSLDKKIAAFRLALPSGKLDPQVYR